MPTASSAVGALLGEAGLVGHELVDCRLRRRRVRAATTIQFVLEPRRLGLEVGDEVGVEQLDPIALQRTSPFGQHGGQPAGPLAQLFDPHQPIAGVALAACRQLGLDRHHRRVEAGQRRLQFALARGALEAWSAASDSSLHPPRGDLAAGDERLERG